MPMEDGDELVAFQDVRVLRSSGPALLCRIGGRSVWLPRSHISGKLWCTGDRGKLLIRRWVACDRHLIDREGVPTPLLVPVVSRPAVRLHVVRKDRNACHAK